MLECEDIEKIEAQYYHSGNADAVFNAMARNRAIHAIEELGIQDKVVEERRNVFLITGKFYFYPPSGKWRVKGKAKTYYSKSFTHFYERITR